MKTLYVALPLTHVKTEEEKQEIRDLMRWFSSTFDVDVLKWAFNLETWKPEPVDNIFDYDSDRVRRADLLAVIYPTDHGSDGRGGEVVLRTTIRKPIVAFKKRGVKVSRYPADCLKNHGIPILEYDNFQDMEVAIRSAIRVDKY